MYEFLQRAQYEFVFVLQKTFFALFVGIEFLKAKTKRIMIGRDLAND